MKLEFKTDKGIGTRATMGLIVLETDETIEPEFSRMTRLPGVALYHSRIPMVAEIRPDTLMQMRRDLPSSTALFPSSLDFDVIGYGCTSAATVIGPDGVQDAVRKARPGVTVTNPLSAVIAACRALDVDKLGFVTPYVAEVSAKMRDRLEAAGFVISGFGSFEEGDDRVVARISEVSLQKAIETVAAQAECDAVFVSCTNLRCLSIIPQIEKKIGRPVLSSNQALGWHMLRLSGIDDTLPEFGKLFTTTLE